jgi:hypothetical protein
MSKRWVAALSLLAGFVGGVKVTEHVASQRFEQIVVSWAGNTVDQVEEFLDRYL